VLHGWHLTPGRPQQNDEAPPLDEFRRQIRDLYVPAGDISFWQAALRDAEDPLYGPVRHAIEQRELLAIDLLYGDHEGGQRTVSRFTLSPPTEPGNSDPWMWVCVVARHWNIDREDPR
jgi:hypothetical protein